MQVITRICDTWRSIRREDVLPSVSVSNTASIRRDRWLRSTQRYICFDERIMDKLRRGRIPKQIGGRTDDVRSLEDSNRTHLISGSSLSTESAATVMIRSPKDSRGGLQPAARRRGWDGAGNDVRECGFVTP